MPAESTERERYLLRTWGRRRLQGMPLMECVRPELISQRASNQRSNDSIRLNFCDLRRFDEPIPEPTGVWVLKDVTRDQLFLTQAFRIEFRVTFLGDPSVWIQQALDCEL
jgi:hypothetical protein